MEQPQNSMEQPQNAVPQPPNAVEQTPTTPEAPLAVKKAPYPIEVEFVYPEKLSRLSTFFRVILVIPQSVVLYFVGLIAGILTLIAWIAILFTGRYPKGLYNYVAGALRWGTRVAGYSYFLTDRYPPFSLK